MVRQRGPRGREGQARRRGRTGQGRRRSGAVQEEIPHQEIHAGRVSAGRGGGRLRRHRRRIHFHQGRADFQGPQAAHSRQDLPAFQGQPHRRYGRGAAKARPPDSRPGRGAEDPGRRHHRLRQGHPEGRDRRRCRAGRDRGAHRGRPALLRRRGRDLRRRRPGHQDHHPEERPRQGFQAEHAVLGGQRLLPAIHRAGLQRAGGAVRRHGIRRQGLPVVRLRLRGVHAERHRGFPAAGMEAGRDHGRPVQRAAQEHLAVRFADSQPLGHRPALPAAGRHAVQPGGGEGAGGFHRVALQGQGRRRPTSSSTSIAAKPAPSARRSKPGRLWDNGRQSTFIGLDACAHIEYKTTRKESHPLLLLQEQVPAHVHRRQD